MTASNQLSIDDLLGDPMTHAIMQADRVDPAELEALLRALAARAAPGAGRSSRDALDRECAPPERNAVGRFLRSMGRGAPPPRVGACSSLRSQLCGTL
jgi:hypothetical protein